MTNLNQVKLARIGRGWTLQKLADEAGISVSYLFRIESGERPIPAKLDKVINIEIESEWFDEICHAVLTQYDIGKAYSILNKLKNAVMR